MPPGYLAHTKAPWHCAGNRASLVTAVIRQIGGGHPVALKSLPAVGREPTVNRRNPWPIAKRIRKLANLRVTILLGSWLVLVFPYSLLASEVRPTCPPPPGMGPAQADLNSAIQVLDVRAVQKALAAGANPNFRYGGGDGLSVLSVVGTLQLLRGGERILPEDEERVIAVLDVLFASGARLGAYDRTILHSPAIGGAARLTKYLLEHGADPNGKAKDGNTPLILATKYGHTDVSNALLAAGAESPDSVTEAQIRLIAAAGRGDLRGVRHELARGADINRKGPTGNTALLTAIQAGAFTNGTLQTVRGLLRLGANPNIEGSFIGENVTMRFIGDCSPLHAAVFNIRMFQDSAHGLEIIDTLLDAGADISSAAFDRKQTPLHLAARMHNTEAAIVLLKAGANVTVRDQDGRTPIGLAGSSYMVNFLKQFEEKK